MIDNKKLTKLPAENAILQESLIISPDEKETIGIDKIRSLLHFLSQKPVLSEKRTVIVRNAENLTNEAQNAILKIAEEPPPQSLMIFIAKSEDFFLPALISRLQKIYFSFTRFKEDLMRERVDLSKTSVEKIVENNQIDQFFESLILNLRRDPVKNLNSLKETLRRLTLIKMLNVNKKLQLKTLMKYVK